MTSRQLMALSGLAIIWGASFLFIRVLVDAGFGPLGISGARCALGVTVLLPLAWSQRGQFPRRRATWMALAILGLVNFAVPWTLFAIGARYVPSGVATITNAAQPLWAAIFATMLIRTESLGRAKAIGLLIGFGGVVLLMEGRVTGLDAGSLRGIPVMLLATLCYGISSVSIRRWLHQVPAIPLTVSQLAVATVILLPAALATGAYDGAEAGWHEWTSLLGLGIAGSGVGVFLYMWLIGQIGPVRASLVTYLMPPIGLALGALLLDEPVGWSMLGGLALIVLGIAVVQGRSLRRRPVPARALSEA